MLFDFIGREIGIVVGIICFIMYGIIYFGCKYYFFMFVVILVELVIDNFFCKVWIFVLIINVSGIKKVNVSIECCIYDMECFFFICSRIKIYGVEINLVYFKIWFF